MLPALRALNAALQEGLVTADEHAKVRRQIMDGDMEVTLRWVPPEVTHAASAVTSQLSSKINELLTALDPRNPERLPKYTRAQDIPAKVAVVAASREEGQRSLLDCNVTAHERRKTASSFS